MFKINRRRFLLLSSSLCLAQIKIPFIRLDNKTQEIEDLWFGYNHGEGNFTA